MLCHLYADVVEEEGSGKAGVKKKGGSMQTISATHRVRTNLNTSKCVDIDRHFVFRNN
jgi:hypothetical protein